MGDYSITCKTKPREVSVNSYIHKVLQNKKALRRVRTPTIDRVIAGCNYSKQMNSENLKQTS